ncbi:MAG: dTMP kinase [Cyanobacteria bacterium KgW148]|nr:dTMP kinase [Cyanobacteria bacterium KgW148]
MSSLFISLEGGEGAGKSTQAKLLAAFLRSQGHQVVLTREPGGTDLGATLRQLFLESDSLTPPTELFLLMADRSHHVSQLIKPSLAAGKIVITDRFTDSTLAYQGFGHGIDKNWIAQLNAEATQGTMPQITFWLDIDPEVGLVRARVKNHHQDRMEKLDLEFHQRVRSGFAHICHNEPDRVKLVDSSQPPEQVHQSIIRLLPQRLVSPP